MKFVIGLYEGWVLNWVAVFCSASVVSDGGLVCMLWYWGRFSDDANSDLKAPDIPVAASLIPHGANPRDGNKVPTRKKLNFD